MQRLIAAALSIVTIAGLGLTAGAPTVGAADDTPWRIPVTPPRCTTAQAEAGDVAGCLLAFYHDPSTTGWGVPPAPGVGPGWSFSGSRYNGSPALADWEAHQIGENDAPIGTLAAGHLETHRAAQPLFEGFLTEITARGYRVRDASGYSFRCTSGNGGWDCPSGDPDDLSNHAWGLAIDMNAGTNPIRRYDGVDGATACATPIETDLPHWVIQAAERWGLYWGGYGWNNGCHDATTQRDSVYRDPPHFEFRGSVEQAAAIAAFNGKRPVGSECFATVTDTGDDAERCNWSGVPEAGWRLPVDAGAPDGATAVMINLTATQPTSHGFLTLETCNAVSTVRTTSALTFAPGDSVATMAVMPLDDDGRFCVYRSTDVHSIVDVVGYLDDGDHALWFDPTRPKRLTDTRANGACRPFQECVAGPVPDRAVHAVPMADERPRLANIAVIEGQGPGFVQAARCDGVGPDHEFSNLNYLGAAVRSNLALMSNGDVGSCVFALTSTHVIVDELGSLDPTDGYGWSLQQPARELDTRECSDTWCDGRPGARQVIELDLDTEAPAVAIGITVTDTAGPGYISAGPCDLFDGGDPETSNVNHMAGQTVTNLALVELVDGRFCLFTHADAHVIVDVQAELTRDQDVGLSPIDPTRVHDSRG